MYPPGQTIGKVDRVHLADQLSHGPGTICACSLTWRSQLCFSNAMAAPIEDYALLSDLQTGPLISRSGSIDWLCFPRFDSPSLFSSLLGIENHGRWLLAPRHSEAAVVGWQYVDSTFVLETVWKTPAGQVQITDFMPVGHTGSSVLRRVTGLEGRVDMY